MQNLTTRLLFAALIFPVGALADTSLNLRASTLGIGPELSWVSQSGLGIRGGGGGLSVDYDLDADDQNGVEGDELNYSGTINIVSGHLLADWYPNKSSFRISAGGILNLSQLTNTASCNNAAGCELGDGRFVPQLLGEITADVAFTPIAPYLGIGWHKPFSADSNWHFVSDIGVAFIGAADIELSSNNTSCEANAQCRAELEQEEEELEKDAESLRFYPVVSLGIGYRINQ